MTKMTDADILSIAKNISNFIYKDNLKAVAELVELIDSISRKPNKVWSDYVRMYDDNFFTYQTWEELVESENEQYDGLTEEELKAEIGKTVWQLSCGWYVQYV